MVTLKHSLLNILYKEHIKDKKNFKKLIIFFIIIILLDKHVDIVILRPLGMVLWDKER